MSKKKRLYAVKMPFAGSLIVMVEADNEDEALEQFEVEYDKSKGLMDPTHELEWEFHEKIVEGNVLHASQNEVEITDETIED